ncbi:MAG: type II toxin-antitoxin system Phd/YefM family antitoxin [Bryobacteraceae bacterium]
MQVNIGEAKTKLSKLVKRATLGEDVIIARAGKPVVKLTKIEPPWKPSKKKRIFGSGAGQVKFIDPDWDKPMTDQEVKEFFGW